MTRLGSDGSLSRFDIVFGGSKRAARGREVARTLGGGGGGGFGLGLAGLTASANARSSRGIGAALGADPTNTPTVVGWLDPDPLSADGAASPDFR